MTTAAVVLAAGAGTRFGGPAHKLLADLHGRPLVRWAVDAAVDASAGAALDEVVVVTGAHADEVATVLPAGVTVVRNEGWEQGLATSLGVAVAAAAAAGHEAVVVGLGDQPFVGADAWRRVAAGRGPIVVASYGSRRRNPVRLEASVWADLPRDGDEGARALIRLRPDLVTPVACEGDPYDVDTPEDLLRWS